jgi:DNA-binding transcriptional LysR family regulator
LQGLGLIQVPRYSVEQDLVDGTLVECLPDTRPSPTSVYVLYPRSRQLSLRVRVFIDWVAEEYAGHIGPVATADIARSSHLLGK